MNACRLLQLLTKSVLLRSTEPYIFSDTRRGGEMENGRLVPMFDPVLTKRSSSRFNTGETTSLASSLWMFNFWTTFLLRMNRIVGGGLSGVSMTRFIRKTFNAFPSKWNTKTLQIFSPTISPTSKFHVKRFSVGVRLFWNFVLTCSICFQACFYSWELKE